MKIITVVLVICAFWSFENYSQWFWQNPYPQGYNLYSATDVDINTLVAVGEFGTIIRSTDNGQSWSVKSQVIDGQFSSIFSVDPNNIYAAGYDYNDTLTKFLKSTNMGNDWEMSVITTPNLPGKLYFFDEDDGFIITHLPGANFSSQILRTSDGGSSWIVSYNYFIGRLYSISFYDNLNGLITTSNGNILRTTNGGNSWDVVVTGNTNALLGVAYSDLQNCIAIGEWGTILLSTDSGLSWNNESSNSSASLWDVEVFENNFVAVGDSGTILTSSDGGTNWVKNPNTDYYELFDISSSGEDGFIFGSEGSMLKTSDAGLNWDYVSRNLNLFSIADIEFHNLNDGISLGARRISTFVFQGLIMKTSDGGNSWESTDTDFLPYSMCVITPDVITIVGTEENIIRTTDGGETWITQHTGTTNDFNGVSFIDFNNGFIIGNESTNPYPNGAVLKTTDGGTNWDYLYNGNLPTLYDLCYLDPNTVVIVGTGIILKTTNAGETWDTLNAGIKKFRSVDFTDLNSGVVVADSANKAILLRTTDGGTSWLQQTMETENLFLYDVSFSDHNNGTIVGEIYSPLYNETQQGIILKTSDAGITWTNQNSGTKFYLNSISFNDNENGWVAGDKGTILHTTDGGVTFVEHQISINQQNPNSSILDQNYPNPFNPSTSIRYSVPQTSLIQIKVYDVLGNEIETLIDEEKPAGSYEIHWDATNLPSGIYFYKLQAGTYVETKKMVLLK